MSMRDRDMHAIAVCCALALTAAIVVPAVSFGSAGAAASNLGEMETIEASLAYKKASKSQPQKQFRPPPPPEEATGLSHDETKAPTPPDPTKKAPPPTDDKINPADYKKFARTDDDMPVGNPSDEAVGAFDGSEYGFAEETRGDPYFQKLVADLVHGWEYPEILADTGTPVGCLHLEASGKIAETKFKEKSGTAELDDSVERALAAIKKLRNDEPVAVPPHLLRAATTKWICFKFKVKK